jgi:hypothetical protein
MTHSLPEAAEAGHLTEALRRSGALSVGVVADVKVETSFATIFSHIFRLRLTYDVASDGPGSVILKAGLIDRPGGPWQGGRREVAFYREVASATPAGLVPRCFEAHWDSDTSAWRLLLEDLTDSHFIATRWPLPPTFEQCENIVRARARFHAAWWDDSRLGATIGEWRDATIADMPDQLAAQFARFADEFGDRLSQSRRDLYARLFDAAPRLVARYDTHRHMTIVQSDAHVWNCFLPRDEGGDAKLFDWDGWRIDIGADDLAYMMAIHWYPDLRGRIERRLLDCYHDELMSRGVKNYDRRALDDDYRLAALWRIMTPVWQHAHGIPPVIWWNNLERIHLAVDDLDCRELLTP